MVSGPVFLNRSVSLQLGAVFVAGGIEPAALVDALRVDDERVAFPAADRVPHEVRIVGEVVGMPASVHVDRSPDRLVLEHDRDHLVVLNEQERKRRGETA